MRTFARVVEDYLGDLRRIRVSGGATEEWSGNGPLVNLVSEIGGGVKSKVFGVGCVAEQGLRTSRRSPLTASQLWRSWPLASSQHVSLA